MLTELTALGDAGVATTRPWAGTLWATVHSVDGQEILSIDMGPRPVPMPNSRATGQPLVSNGLLGADVIRLAAGDGFAPHTHPGDHFLIVIGGEGTITYDGQIVPTRAGEIYLIEGAVPHAVGAITDHVLLAVGSPHRPVDAPDRMRPLEYLAVTTELGRLHCLICDRVTVYPERPHDVGCPHCPCVACHPIAGISVARPVV